MTSAGEIVIGDVHARSSALWALLTSVGAIDRRGRRRGRWRIVQLGDLLDVHAGPEVNLRTAELAAATLDVVLAGNHEARLLRGCGAGHGPALATLAARGWPHAAAACGGWLTTHAGIHPALGTGLPDDVAECAAEINHRWHTRVADPLFDAVGPSRDGPAPHGGLLWLHHDEWSGAVRPKWPQITGHVPVPEPRLLPGPRWAIDVGQRRGRLAALVRPAGEHRWHPVVVQRSRGGRERHHLSAPLAA